MELHRINMDTWVRRSHYEVYTTKLPLHWNVTCELDITALQKVRRERKLRLYPAMLYAVVSAVNAIPEFRMAYDAQGCLGYYDSVVPGYTIFHSDDHTFSDIWSEFDTDYAVFYQTVLNDMKKYSDVKGYLGRPERPPNCCPISMAPWLPFTGCSFDTFSHTQMLLPVITFGKIRQQEKQEILPFSVFCSHAVADGWHAAELFRLLQSACDTAEDWMKVH